MEVGEAIDNGQREFLPGDSEDIGQESERRIDGIDEVGGLFFDDAAKFAIDLGVAEHAGDGFEFSGECEVLLVESAGAWASDGLREVAAKGCGQGFNIIEGEGDDGVAGLG